MYRIIFHFIILIFYSNILLAQKAEHSSEHWRENGLPYIQNFSPKDYNAEIQNFTIAQDEHGLMYFGNNKGVLIYDGVSWRTVPTSNKTLARSLCLIKDKIYVGAEGDFGYLSPDSTGELKFVSLLNLIPEKNRDFHDVYQILSNKDTIYFRTRNYIFRLYNKQVKVWYSDKQFDQFFIFNNTLYVAQQKTGLLQMKNDSLQLIPDGEIFSDITIRNMFPYDKSQFVISTFKKGLFLCDGRRVKRFPTVLDNFFSKNYIFSSINLQDSLLAIATSRGVVILDKKGNLCQIINKSSGLSDEFVINLFEDAQGGLWLALNNGIARVETPSPVSRFQDASGIESFVLSIIRFHGILYAATDRGVYYLDSNEFPFPKFKPVSGFSALTFTLVNTGEHLLAGSESAVYEIAGTHAAKISKFNTEFLYHSKIDTNRVYVALIEGFAGLEFIDGNWIEISPVQGINERIIAISENPDGSLWFGTEYENLFKANVKMQFTDRNNPQMKIDITHYGKEYNFPQGIKVPVLVNGYTVFATLGGLKYFDERQKRFLPETTFGKVFADTTCEIDYLYQDKDNDIWIVAKKNGKTIQGKSVLQPDGSYVWEETPFLRINDLGNSYLIYPEENGIAWFGGSEGIARYSSFVKQDYNFDYPAVIRRVTAIISDSSFYNGNLYPGFSNPEIDYKNNSIRFQFAASSYDGPAANLFQVKLDGYDDNWSSWSLENKKDYTGLPAGKYTFRVRAKNIYNHLSKEDTFAFEILPPWFQSGWAYLLYLFFLGAVVFSIVKIRVRQLEKRTRQLEDVISERTSTILEQTEKLKELDSLKSRFFANISHEFRTPLTLILGIVERYLAKQGSDTHDFNIMKKNAQRLLHLINQMLELSKLQAGSTIIKVEKTDLIKFIRRTASSFISLAEQRKIEFKFNGLPLNIASEEKEIFVYIDRDKMETVIYNLLSNAFKFTPEGKKVLIDVVTIKDFAEIKIRNTGIEISPEHLPHIFDRFYQVNSSSTRNYEGTGIGLALVKDFIELHHGKVNVESNNSETIFKIRIPLGSTHFSSGEIAESPEEVAEDRLHPVVKESEIKEEIIRKPPLAESNIILVVEDHFDLRNFICEQLEDNYSVVEAEDGAKGLALAEDIIPDLVISDIMMPNMDGYTLCRELKTNMKTNHIPVILLTAKASFENKLEGLETGADDYLIKPFNTEELKARVKNLIKIRKQIREKFQTEILLKPANIIVPSGQKVFIEKLTKIIEDHIEEEDFNVEVLCKEIAMSRAQLHRKIKAITNQSTSEFVRTFRLQRAADLIKQNVGNMAEIAYKVGFNSQAYFTKSFQEFYGCTPKEYSRRNS